MDVWFIYIWWPHQVKGMDDWISYHIRDQRIHGDTSNIAFHERACKLSSLLLSFLLLNGFTFSSLFKTWVYTRTLHSWLTLLFSIKSIPAWFTILDSASSVLKSACCILCFFRTCEICGTTAHNVVTSTEAEMIEQLSEMSNAAVTPQSETRSFWRGHRFLNFLLACMVFAFVISWLLHFNVPP